MSSMVAGSLALLEAKQMPWFSAVATFLKESHEQWSLDQDTPEPHANGAQREHVWMLGTFC